MSLTTVLFRSGKYLLAVIVSLASGQTITLPAGTAVPFTVTQPIWVDSAKAGDAIFGLSSAPVLVRNRVVIPPSSAIQGVIDIDIHGHGMRRELRIRFNTLILRDDYVVSLSGKDDTQFSSTTLTIYPAARNDLLLDNGSQFEFTLGRALEIDVSKIPPLGKLPPHEWKSATRCEPIPSREGTSDTVIPGTDPTPPTVIPGTGGSPDVVIPGTAGTSPTVIKGNDPTPEIPCPLPSVVSHVPTEHKETLVQKSAFTLGSTYFKAGSYVFRWKGLGPLVDVSIKQKEQTIATLKAIIRPANVRGVNTLDRALQTVQFQNQPFVLKFDSIGGQQP